MPFGCASIELCNVFAAWRYVWARLKSETPQGRAYYELMVQTIGTPQRRTVARHLRRDTVWLMQETFNALADLLPGENLLQWVSRVTASYVENEPGIEYITDIGYVTDEDIALDLD